MAYPHKAKSHSFFPYNAASLVTVCVDGQVVFGRNTATNAFGVVYDFFASQVGTVPTGSSYFGGMGAFGLTVDPATHPHAAFEPAKVGVSSFSSPLIGLNFFLTSGVAYLPDFYEGSQLLPQNTVAAFRAEDRSDHSPGGGFTGFDDSWGPLTVTVTSTPEPSTVALMATGLVAMLPVIRRRRRPRVG